MKNIFYCLFCLISIALISTACGSEDDINNNDDNNRYPMGALLHPDTTRLVSVKNYDNGGTKVSIYNGSFGIDSDNNFVGIDGEWYFAPLQKTVKGMIDIDEIPESGWGKTCAVRSDSAYVAACCYRNKITFVRIYVYYEIASSYAKSDTRGFEIIYQYPFNGGAESIEMSGDNIYLDYKYQDSDRIMWTNMNSAFLIKNKVSCELIPDYSSGSLSVDALTGSFTFDGNKIGLKITYQLPINLSQSEPFPDGMGLILSGVGFDNKKIMLTGVR
jgi:hypothetical protein